MKTWWMIAMAVMAFSATGKAEEAVTFAGTAEDTSIVEQFNRLVEHRTSSCPPGFVAVYDVGYGRWTCVIASCGGGNYNNCDGGGS